MPARKPTGAVTSAETSTSGSVRRIGCQLAPQRMRTTIPKPIPPKRTNIQAPRRSPGPRSSRRQPPVGLGACWRSWAAAVVVTLRSFLLLVTRFLRRLDEERDEGVELRLRQRLPECPRHDVLLVAGLGVGVRVDDRLVDERPERLVRRLCVRDEVVEVRPDLARRVGGAQRVAAR